MTAPITRLSIAFTAALVLTLLAYSAFGQAIGTAHPSLKIIATVVAHGHRQMVGTLPVIATVVAHASDANNVN
jgi:hypothetical protein